MHSIFSSLSTSSIHDAIALQHYFLQLVHFCAQLRILYIQCTKSCWAFLRHGLVSLFRFLPSVCQFLSLPGVLAHFRPHLPHVTFVLMSARGVSVNFNGDEPSAAGSSHRDGMRLRAGTIGALCWPDTPMLGVK